MPNDPNVGVIAEPGAAPPAPPAPAPPAVDWYANADPEIRGYLENRGWNKLGPAEAALAAAKAHREASQYIGVPENKLLKLAEPTDAVAYKAMWQRLGAADTPDKYDLSIIKDAKGQPLPETEAKALQAAFAEANVPLTQAQQVAAAIVKQRDAQAAATYEAEQQTLATNKDALAKQWSTNFDSNMYVAKQAAAKLGVTPEAVAALEKTNGYAATMEMFRVIGTQMGEARFITNTLPTGEQAPFTRDGATARIAELKSDPAWVQRYTNGGAAEMRQLQALLEVQAGQRFSDIRAA